MLTAQKMSPLGSPSNPLPPRAVSAAILSERQALHGPCTGPAPGLTRRDWKRRFRPLGLSCYVPVTADDDGYSSKGLSLK